MLNLANMNVVLHYRSNKFGYFCPTIFNMLSSALAPVGQPFHIKFHSKSQPSFNKNFDALIRAMHDWKAAGYEVYIFSENAKQLTRHSPAIRSASS